MAEDWNTVNVSRDKALGREIDLLRQHYLEHRETLGKLASNAPTEVLAREYVRLQSEIDQSIGKLNELERGGSSSGPRTAPGTGFAPPIAPAPGRVETPRSVNTSPARPGPMASEFTPSESSAGPGTFGRMALIAVAGLIVLGVLGYLVWRRSSHHADRPVIQEAATRTLPAPAPEQPVAVASSVAITPAAYDFGHVRKGTRAVHKFELANHSGSPFTPVVSRSSCKCLWFQYQPSIAPDGKGTVSVTIDGGRARKGAVHETVTVTDKKDSQTSASFDVTANID